MTPARTCRSANGSIIPCAFDIVVNVRSDLMDMGAKCNGATLTYATSPIASHAPLVNFFTSAMQPYIQFLMLLALAVIAGTTMIVASHFLGPRRPTEVKERPYESGMPPLGDAHERFSVKFYLVAVLFILFDIETVFLIPWGAIYLAGGATGPGLGFLLDEMPILLAILVVGYAYVWKWGAVEWD